MHFVDDELIHRRGSEVVTLPVVGVGVGDDAIADRACHVAGIGVDPGDYLFAGHENEAVLVAHLRPDRLTVPVAVVLADELEFGRADLLSVIFVTRWLSCPVIERSSDGDGLGVWGPYSKRSATIDETDAHAFSAVGVVRGDRTCGGVVGHRSPCCRNNHSQRYPSEVWKRASLMDRPWLR